MKDWIKNLSNEELCQMSREYFGETIPEDSLLREASKLNFETESLHHMISIAPWICQELADRLENKK